MKASKYAAESRRTGTIAFGAGGNQLERRGGLSSSA
jgi:hypothetical protein